MALRFTARARSAAVGLGGYSRAERTAPPWVAFYLHCRDSQRLAGPLLSCLLQ